MGAVHRQCELWSGIHTNPILLSGSDAHPQLLRRRKRDGDKNRIRDPVTWCGWYVSELGDSNRELWRMGIWYVFVWCMVSCRDHTDKQLHTVQKHQPSYVQNVPATPTRHGHRDVPEQWRFVHAIFNRFWLRITHGRGELDIMGEWVLCPQLCRMDAGSVNRELWTDVPTKQQLFTRAIKGPVVLSGRVV